MSNIEYFKQYINHLITIITNLISPDHIINIVIIILIIASAKFSALLINKRVLNKISIRHSYLKALTNPILSLILLSAYGIFTSNSHYNKKIIVYCSILILTGVCIKIIDLIIRKVFYKKRYCNFLASFITYSLWVTIIIHITDSNNYIIDLLDHISFKISKTQDISIWDIIKDLVIIISAITISTVITNFIEKRVNVVDTIDSNLRQIIIRITKIAVFILSLLVILPLIGIDITALSVFGGAVGVGIGFGLQKISSNFLSGFIILLDRSIKVGDRLIIDNNTGVITKITMRYVVMLRADGTELLIPNETFITTNIQNQSYSNTEIRGEIICCIDKSNDIRLAINKISNVIDNTPDTINKSSIIIHKFVDSGVELKCHFWVSSPSILTNTSNYIYIELIKLFNNGEIIQPQTSQRLEIIKSNQ